jgi:hypothetical protein
MPTKVVMDQHGSHHLLIVGRGIVRVAEEIVEKELVGGVHLYLGGKLSNSLRPSSKKLAGEEKRASAGPGSWPGDVRRAWQRRQTKELVGGAGATSCSRRRRGGGGKLRWPDDEAVVAAMWEVWRCVGAECWKGHRNWAATVMGWGGRGLAVDEGGRE